MKHRSTIFLVLLFLPLMVLAQKPKVKNDPTHDDKPIHFGFSLGVNSMDYRVEQSQLASDNRVYVGVKEVVPGIDIHAIANLRLAENFDLRALPGISFNDRYIYYQNIDNPAISIYGEETNDPVIIESAYLEIPIHFKYKSIRLNNFRPYLIGGANYRYDLGVKREYDPQDQRIMIAKSDYYAELGFGMDFYLTYFKFAVEIKYSMGLSNILRGEDRHGDGPGETMELYTDYINSINSQIVVISFHFE